ncbi:MAG: hypothetical protein JWQ04_2714, partial [Pedosphaera sp.]|nr:hypothetical protein [Pedosphaera sp.]
AGEPLGQVVNWMIDLPTARVVYAVVSFAGSGSDLYAVPPGAFQNATDRAGLVLDVDKAKIASLARSDGFFWSNMADSNWGLAVYRNFGQQADFDTAAGVSTAQDPTRENVRAQVQTGAVPAANAAPIKGDRELQQEILTAMMRDNVDNALTFNHVQIKASSGQVTLNGKVKNEKQREKIVAIVAGVVGAANVHEQLQLK